VEELTDILVGLGQRIHAYKNRFQELEKKKRRLDDEIATIKKYLELAETLYRVEADKAKLASLSSQIIPDDSKGVRTLPVTDVTDQSREILLGRSKYVGKSVPEATYEILRESTPSHACEGIVATTCRRWVADQRENAADFCGDVTEAGQAI
jgi:hypothetical protein